MLDHECDCTTPGGVYLCQTDESLSCGACCGLYNVDDPSFGNLTELLRRRTELFGKTARDFDSLIRFKEQVEAIENQERPYPEFHHCPYIGFVGPTLSRPGCLLHPLNTGNDSVDHRGLSDWGGLACATYFCPTCWKLPARYKKILRMCCDTWYIYGLIIPETDMISSYFSLIEQKISCELDASSVFLNDAFKAAVQRFFHLKTTWAHRPEGFNRLGNYFFNDNLYPRFPIDYQRLEAVISDKDEILMALGSEFRTKKELESADQLLSEIIQAAVDSIRPIDHERSEQ
jgi:hypothetical protein